MEQLSILNPPVTDMLNDPRVTSAALVKMINEQERSVHQQLAELLVKVKQGEAPFDVLIFHVLQHQLHVTTLNTKLTARTTDLMYQTVQLNLRLERLTTILIGLTVVLGVFAIPLAIDVVLKWLK